MESAPTASSGLRFGVDNLRSRISSDLERQSGFQSIFPPDCPPNRHDDVMALVADEIEVFLMRRHVPRLRPLHFPENAAIIAEDLPVPSIGHWFHAYKFG
jgi:hypothetical protein